MTRRVSRRTWIATGIGVGAAALVARPVVHLGGAIWRDGSGEAPLPPGTTDDASHLEQTRVGEIVRVSGDGEAVTAQVRGAIERAAERGWPVSIAGARHTMGGHTAAPGGLLLDMSGADHIAIDGDVLRAGSGARWHDVIRALDARGRAVEVMQSNADFSIGGSLGANCHGWQPGRAPIASTVESFTMVLAGGQVARCSRSENAELFRHAIGGYGLFGVMTEVSLRTTANRLVTSERRVLGLEELGPAFVALGDAELAFGRLSIETGSLRFEETLLTAYRGTGERPPALVDPPRDDLARALFRGEVGSDYGKELRWRAERWLGGEGGERASRNQLMLEPVARFGNRRRDRTDILFEGFVPPAALAPYARTVRRIVARHEGDLLNVTVRHVLEDRDTVLRYATREVLGLVMLFSQPRSRAADERTLAMTRAMIDAALDHGGRYYLPYRPHATRGQLRRTYPEAEGWAAFKRASDPSSRFRNRFWDRYFRS